MNLHLSTIPAAQLAPTLRREILGLCLRAYEEDLEPLFASWGDAVHVVGHWQGQLATHGLWVPRSLQVGDGPLLHTAYVEAVATEPALQRRGFAAAVMQRIAAEIEGFALGALSPFDVGYYGRLGWELWQGPRFIRSATGLLPTPDEEVMILRLPATPPLNLHAPLSAEWREGELW
ncbi:MAG: GNAT family N-acetyltransferase [Chloroflexaceae bacterium]|jgi:aminoglycoside 2'-N-acetyltransferase I|nr:GNAT family N-acetyltransferase [Chloroflexaceae bacterium]